MAYQQLSETRFTHISLEHCLWGLGLLYTYCSANTRPNVYKPLLTNLTFIAHLMV